MMKSAVFVTTFLLVFISAVESKSVFQPHNSEENRRSLENDHNPYGNNYPWIGPWDECLRHSELQNGEDCHNYIQERLHFAGDTNTRIEIIQSATPEDNFNKVYVYLDEEGKVKVIPHRLGIA
mmetsp:Transcript_15172/g.22370  ORF Transcript_15172/g.22370 Transcript_15172/m.22370 type:complete len:123 (-) Transcript_15172:135-503(-)|eukprot:CAMPEP_0195511816 /NCGR_PEP_ID=MMETSP0794_2-20130614/4004_1 /TAXON_ID=515487 /ORGANISM="Stephanopyxis turris, Strain CCMP 815" /LENGTH=122 /DNA_ID=CAMNT_0040639481 /DNA_START=125 /DNA_END=493 /DNA_ORIENTATION=+